jgi:CO/xanthine dehydrogenase Mo-binding subunit
LPTTSLCRACSTATAARARAARAHSVDRHVEGAALPGVHAVITGEDFADHLRHPARQSGRARLCVGRVRFVGDPVAAVAAVDEDTASRR